MTILDKLCSRDGSVKYLWQLSDGNTVESIYFTFRGQVYICASSQVGCNIGCPFCETGKQKKNRNLYANEIYEQIAIAVEDLALDHKTIQLDQVAIQGMGEPLLNFDNLKEAVSKLKSDKLTNSVSICTSGMAPQIRLLNETDIDTLFISLHATTDNLRNTLVPTNKKYPISEILTSAYYFYEKVANPVILSYMMFEGVNDSDEDLNRLMDMIDQQAFIIQLAELNPTSHVNFTQSKRIEYFEENLANSGFNVYITRSKGLDIGGGCGQLRSRYSLKDS